MSATTQSSQAIVILRPYQKELIQQIYTAWADGHKKVLAQLPTAAGKTLAFAQIAKEFAARGEQVLILTHRKELIEQAVAKIKDITNLDVGIIRSGVESNPTAPIQVASVQSLKSRLANVPNISVVIVDEAHHSTAAGWQSILKHFSKRYILGVTATPTRLNGDGFNDLYDVLIQGASMQSLIKDGYLSKYRVFADPHPMNTDGVGRLGGDYKPTDLAKQNNITELAGHLIDSYKRIANGTQAIVFAINIEHSKSIAARYNAEGISARHLDGKSDPTDRTETLELFRKGELKIICNCNLFDEGVDLPSVGCVQLARPTQSLTRYLQMIGRGLRLVEGKNYAIVIDHTRNYQAHGLPDVEREWTLDGVETKQEQLGKTKDGEIVAVDRDEKESKQIIELVEIELVEVKRWRIEIPYSFKQRYLDGESANFLAKEFGCGAKAFANWLKKQGVKIRKPKTLIDIPSIFKQRYIDGESTLSLAKELGCVCLTFMNWLRRQGVKIRKPKKLIDIPSIFKQRYLDGESANFLAKEFGCGAKAFTNWLRRQGVKIRKPKTPIDIPLVFKQRYINGETITYLAKELGCAHSTFILWLRRQGVTTRHRNNNK